MPDLLASLPELPVLVAFVVAAILWRAVRRVLAGIALAVVLLLTVSVVLNGLPPPLGACWSPTG